MTTLFRTTRSRLALAAAAAALAAPMLLTGPASAGLLSDLPVSGVDSCNATTGQHEITWTLINNVNETVTVGSAALSGAATGNPTFTPNPITFPGTATAVSTLPGSTVGTVLITVVSTWVDGEFPMTTTSTAEVDLAACVQPTTTTTSTTSTTAPSTTTTTTPPAVTAVAVTPRFTG